MGNTSSAKITKFVHTTTTSWWFAKGLKIYLITFYVTNGGVHKTKLKDSTLSSSAVAKQQTQLVYEQEK